MSDSSGVAEERFVTVAEAAALLGVSERTLRRLISLPANAGRTRQEHRQTKTGRRVATVLPVVELEALGRQLVEAEAANLTPTPNTGNGGGANGGETPAERGEHRQDATVRSVELADALTRAAVAEAQVVELRERVAVADAALVREQETAARLAARLEDADQRLASVLAATGRLQISDIERDDLCKPTGGDSGADSGQGDTSPAPEDRDASTGRVATARASWWARLWGRA